MPAWSPPAPSFPRSSSCTPPQRRLASLSLRSSYYIAFTELYSLSLRQADYVMVNSTWTYNHISRLLQTISHRDDEPPPRLEITPPSTATTPTKPGSVLRERTRSEAASEAEPPLTAAFREAHIVYPPCDCSSLAQLPLEMREVLLLSIAQFRCATDSALRRPGPELA